MGVGGSEPEYILFVKQHDTLSESYHPHAKKTTAVTVPITILSKIDQNSI